MVLDPDSAGVYCWVRTRQIMKSNEIKVTEVLLNSKLVAYSFIALTMLLAAVRLARRAEEFNLCILNVKFAQFRHHRNEITAVRRAYNLILFRK